MIKGGNSPLKEDFTNCSQTYTKGDYPPALNMLPIFTAVRRIVNIASVDFAKSS